MNGEDMKISEKLEQEAEEYAITASYIEMPAKAKERTMQVAAREMYKEAVAKGYLAAAKKYSSEPVKDELLEALKTLVKTYIANLGSGSEFVICITPKGMMPEWANAIKLIAKAEGKKEVGQNGN